MADFNIYLTTFNCARHPLNIDYFSTFLFDGLSQSNPLPPDLVVLSLQEVAPIGYSFLGGAQLTPYFDRFTQAIQDATRSKFASEEVVYHEPVVRNVGLTSIMVFAKEEAWHRIRWIETGGVGVGLWDMGNKGAVGVRLGLSPQGNGEEDVIFTFVAAHLAPMEPEWQRRNQDWESICQGLVFEREVQGRPTLEQGAESETEPLLSKSQTPAQVPADHHTLFDPPSYLFLLGDLNYRTSDTPPTPGAHESWPQPVADPTDPRHYTHLLPHDQLSREKHQGHTLHHLTEAPVAFPPTYKYASAAQKHAAHAVKTVPQTRADGRTNMVTRIERPEEQGDEVWLWAPHRVPSWCDRILFLEGAEVAVKAYEALPVQPTSDHRPVVLACSVPRTAVASSVKAPFGVREGWRERRVAARRLEVLVGVAAYLGLTWEGETLLLGTVVGLVGGYLALRALLAS